MMETVLFHTVIITCNKGKVVPVLNYAPHHEDVLGELGYSSTHS
jgi:hypothetical protein